MLANSTASFYTGVRAPEVEDLFDRVLPQMREEILSCAIPRLTGIWLGGGYGRGEGGVCRGTDGRLGPYNDIDFFVFMEDATEVEKTDCASRLEPIARRYEKVFGVDVDFCHPRNPSDFKKDEDRLMIQELKRGHVALIGGEGLLSHVKALAPNELPRMEALRLLMNRGMGLIFAALRVGSLKTQGDVNFFLRNLNKAILGVGDAQLIARHEYAWRIGDRAKRLGDARYDAAVNFKFRPRMELPKDVVSTWKSARDYWFAGVEKVELDTSRTLRQAARWVVRRHTFGPIASFGQDCTVRVLRQVHGMLEQDLDKIVLSDALEKDWMCFN